MLCDKAIHVTPFMFLQSLQTDTTAVAPGFDESGFELAPEGWVPQSS